MADEDDSSEAVILVGCLFDIVAYCKHIIVDADAEVEVDAGVDDKWTADRVVASNWALICYC